MKDKGCETTSAKRSNSLKNEAYNNAEISSECSQCIFKSFGTHIRFETVNLHKLYHSLSVYRLSVALIINLSVKLVCF